MPPHTKGVTDDRTLRAVLGGLATLGLLVSAYLTWVHFAGLEPVCAAGSHGCQTVQASRYATVLSVPVAVLGLGGYFGLLLAAVSRGEAGAYFGLLVALVGTLFSAYLTYLEVFVIGAVCQWCVASAAIMAASLACAALRTSRPPARR